MNELQVTQQFPSKTSQRVIAFRMNDSGNKSFTNERKKIGRNQITVFAVATTKINKPRRFLINFRKRIAILMCGPSFIWIFKHVVS